MRANEFIIEGWTQKYKKSINCSHPKGFSQKAHCAGKKKHNESINMEMTCEDCGMCQTHGNITEIKKGSKDSNGFTKCWPGKHAEGTKKGKNGGQVRNCVPNESQGVAEGEKKGLYYYVNKRKKAGTSRDASSPKAPSAQAWKDAAKTAKKEGVAEGERTMSRAAKGNEKYGKDGMKALAKAGRDGAGEKKLDAIRDKHDKYDESVDELSRIQKLSGLALTETLTADQQFDIIEEMVEQLAEEHGVDPDVIWEDFESVDDVELLDESAAWRNKSGKNKNGGLNAKGVASYRRENPGSKLQTAVTTKPSKLKPGSKAAKRRKSFCARMGGMQGAMKKPNGKPTRKALALRKWNC